MNFLGRGINLGAGFVVSTKPLVPEAHAGLGLRLHVGVPPIGGPNGVGLSVTGLYNDGSEFYRTLGPDSDADPGRFVATRVRRAGGVLTAGKTLPHNLHVTAALREEAVSATLPPPSLQSRTLPDLTTVPIDFMIQDGSSRVGTHGRQPRLRHPLGSRVAALGNAAGALRRGGTSLLGSSYSYVKTVFNGSWYLKMPHGHALGFHLFGGAIEGDAPYFDRFFIGDLDLLLPRRALGINFSTQPASSFLGSSIAAQRYDNYAGRLLVEYAVPVWRHHGWVYGGDAFVAFGVLGMASDEDMLIVAADRSDRRFLGLRLDTYVGVFTVSIANVLSRSSF